VNPYLALNTVVKLLESAKLSAWKSFSDPYFDSIKKWSSSFCVMPAGFNSETPQESGAGRLGMYSFRVRIYSHQKEDIDGDSALKFLYETQLEKLLDALCGSQGIDPNYFQGVIFLTNISEPGKAYLDKEDFLRFVDCNFQVYLGLF